MSENSLGQRLRNYLRENYRKTGDPRIFVSDTVAVMKFFLGDLQDKNPEAQSEINSFKIAIEFLDGVDLEQEFAT